MKTTIIVTLLSLAFAAQAETVRPPPSGFPPKPIVTEAPKPAEVTSMQQSQTTLVRLQSSNTLNSTTAVGVNFEAQERNPVSSAAGNGLTSSSASSSNGTCFGSGGVGAQGASIGFNFASTNKDLDCNRRYNSMRMQDLGYRAAATELMCADPDVRAAMKAAKTPCLADDAVQQTAATKADEPTDPYVRRRLGLPAL